MSEQNLIDELNGVAAKPTKQSDTLENEIETLFMAVAEAEIRGQSAYLRYQDAVNRMPNQEAALCNPGVMAARDEWQEAVADVKRANARVDTRKFLLEERAMAVREKEAGIARTWEPYTLKAPF